MLLPSRMIGVMPKMPSVSRPCSTPTMGFPVVLAVTTVMRRAEMSSPNDLWIVQRGKTVAGGRLKVIRGMPCAFSAFLASPSSADRAARSPLATASATCGMAAIAVLTASAARPS